MRRAERAGGLAAEKFCPRLQGVLDELRCGVLHLTSGPALSVGVQDEAAASLPLPRICQLLHVAARGILADLDRLQRDPSAPVQFAA
jgi:hypothetical protein